MAAIFHTLDQRRLIDSNGIADGASIYFYTTGTLTPAAVYTSSALDTEHSSPIVVAAGAAVPDIYLDSTVTYRRRIVYPDGTVDDSDPYDGGVVRASGLASSTGAALIGDTKDFTGAGPRTQHDINMDVVSIFDFFTAAEKVSWLADPDNYDVTTIRQRAFDHIGAITAGSSNNFATASAAGCVLRYPAGVFRTTATLYRPSNIVEEGTGWGTRFVFDPAVANSDYMVGKHNATGGSLSKAVFSVVGRNFLVTVAFDGTSWADGRGGSTIAGVNTNARHCFNFENSTHSRFENVGVVNFWYGEAFRFTLATGYAFYNNLTNCFTRDCQLSWRPTSAGSAVNCNWSHSSQFPPTSLQSTVQYAVIFDGATVSGCSDIGGSVEVSVTNAIYKHSSAGHVVEKPYVEAFGSTPAFMEMASLNANGGGTRIGSSTYGYTPHITLDENTDRAGSSSSMSFGITTAYGTCDEIELEQYTTRESPSNRYGLPGRGHSPAGGTISVTTDGFIGNTCETLTRGAGTAATENQMSYNFKIRNTETVHTNLYLTFLIKPVGETNFDLRLITTGSGTCTPKLLITYSNGWRLYGTYIPRSNNELMTFYMRQLAGSTDTAVTLKCAAIRAYTNGFPPIPGSYKFPEYRNAVPSAGAWLVGDVVWNAGPAAAEATGWICTVSGSPGTWEPFGIIGAARAASVALAAGATPTKAEFDALVNSLKTAKLMA
jgi:hypothetical protein